MVNYEVQIKDLTTGQDEHIATNGVVVLYLDQGKVKVMGKIEFAEIMPYLAELALKKFASK